MKQDYISFTGPVDICVAGVALDARPVLSLCQSDSQGKERKERKRSLSLACRFYDTDMPGFHRCFNNVRVPINCVCLVTSQSYQQLGGVTVQLQFVWLLMLSVCMLTGWRGDFFVGLCCDSGVSFNANSLPRP